MPPLLLSPVAGDPWAARLAATLGWEEGRLELRRFPDGETYLRFDTPPAGREVVLAASLDRPDPKLPGLLFAAATARELGAARVGLVAPYLPYLRQDCRFRPGEAVTARCFGHLLSGAVDWLVTVDPHLHRIASLGEVFAIPATAVPSAPVLAAWIAGNVPRPVVVGPDAESEQWVAAVAGLAGAPYRVLAKERRGDRDVSVGGADLSGLEGRTPVLVDDILSTGRTLVEAVRCLRAAGLPPPVCLVVHALFSDEAGAALREAGADRVVTANTVTHPSNKVDLAAAIAEACRAFVPEA